MSNLAPPPKILLVRSTGFTQEWIDQIVAAFPGVDFLVADDNEQAIHEAIPEANVLVGCPRHIFTPRLLELNQGNLVWVHSGGAGVEPFIFPEFVDSDIVFTNGRIIQGPEVADHAVALLLCLTRNIFPIIADRGPRPLPRPLELRKKTALVFGLGGIGMLVADRLKAFGMRIIAVTNDYAPMVSMVDEFHDPLELMEVLPEADAVLCAAPETGLTRGVFAYEQFKAMKADSFFINVSRGPLVKTEDLVAVLEEGHLRGVGLDVTDPEPLSEAHPLRSMYNVLITPHIAGPSDHNRRRSFELTKANIERFLQGRSLFNVVRKDAGY